jgi:hypothetical protein
MRDWGLSSALTHRWLEQPGCSDPDQRGDQADPTRNDHLEGPQVVSGRIPSGLDRNPPQHREHESGGHRQDRNPYTRSKQMHCQQPGQGPQENPQFGL